jgi:hypothetical protein
VILYLGSHSKTVVMLVVAVFLNVCVAAASVAAVGVTAGEVEIGEAVSEVEVVVETVAGQARPSV